MRMDHHCPWVGNCVGHNNHKLFINFLFNALTGCTTVVLSITNWVSNNGFDQLMFNEAYFIVFLLSGALCLSLGGLLGAHLYLIILNGSTIEMQ